MKLRDCDCGGIPEVVNNFNDNKEFVIACHACGNQTPICDSLREAIILWNQTYCRSLKRYEMVSM